MSSVKILPDGKNGRITSAYARAFKPKWVVRLKMIALDPPERTLKDKISEITPSSEQLKNMASQYPAPEEWYNEEDD